MYLFSLLVFLKPFIYERIFVYAHAAWSGLLFLYLVWHARRRNAISLDTVFSVSAFLCTMTAIISFAHTILHSRQRYLDFMHVYTLIAGVLLAILSFTHGKDRRLLMKTIALSSIGICGIALYTLVASRSDVVSYLQSHRLSAAFAEEFLNRQRTFYPFVSPDTLGGFLLLSLSMTLPFVRENKIYAWILALQLLTVLGTKSLGTYAALFLGIFLYVLLTRRQKRTVAAAGFLIGGGIALAALYFFRQHTEGAHLTPLFSLQQRVQYLTQGLRMIAEHPFWGWGFGQYYQTTGVKYTHNLFLQLWAEGGILLVAAVSFFIAHTVFRAIRNVSAAITPESRVESVALLCAFCGFTIHNLVDFEFFILQASYAWWICCGLIHYIYCDRRVPLPGLKPRAS